MNLSNEIHDFLWTYFPNQNIFSKGVLVPESSVIARGQILKACSTQRIEWNENVTSYSGSTLVDLCVEQFKSFFGQHVFNIGNLCCHIIRIYLTHKHPLSDQQNVASNHQVTLPRHMVAC